MYYFISHVIYCSGAISSFRTNFINPHLNCRPYQGIPYNLVFLFVVSSLLRIRIEQEIRKILQQEILLILRTIKLFQQTSRSNPSLSLIWTSCDAFMRAKKDQTDRPLYIDDKNSKRKEVRFAQHRFRFSLVFFFHWKHTNGGKGFASQIHLCRWASMQTIVTGASIPVFGICPRVDGQYIQLRGYKKEKLKRQK